MKRMKMTDNKAARLAGFLFSCVCMPLAFWGEEYVWSQVFVRANPVATANNLLLNESIFRASIASHFAGILVFAWMISLLGGIFRPVDACLSKAMLAPILAIIPIVFILEMVSFTALMVVKGEARPGLTALQQQECSYLLLRIHAYGASATKVFFGLCFLPFGMLVFRSGSLPRIFGILLLISGAAYVLDSLFYVLLQRPAYLTIHQLVKYTSVGYVLTFLWLLVKGVRHEKEVETKFSIHDIK